ncbi:MAG: hypothetical protein KAI17_18405, partial [Thiotrichaceae bacterium]|nr:hypothetical protein [Thiotrichaceae bacterium]
SIDGLKASAINQNDEFMIQVNRFVGLADKTSNTISSLAKIDKIFSDEKRSEVMKAILANTIVVQQAIDIIVSSIKIADPDFVNTAKEELLLIKIVNQVIDVMLGIEACDQMILSDSSLSSTAANCLSLGRTGLKTYQVLYPAETEGEKITDQYIDQVIAGISALQSLLKLKKIILNAQEIGKSLSNTSSKGIIAATTAAVKIVNMSLTSDLAQENIKPEIRSGITTTVANLSATVGCFKGSGLKQTEACIDAFSGVVSQYLEGVSAGITAYRLDSVIEQSNEAIILNETVKAYMLHGGNTQLLTQTYNLYATGFNYKAFIETVASGMGYENSFFGEEYNT